MGVRLAGALLAGGSSARARVACTSVGSTTPHATATTHPSSVLPSSVTSAIVPQRPGDRDGTDAEPRQRASTRISATFTRANGSLPPVPAV